MSSYREAEGIAILERLNVESSVAVAVDTETTGLKVYTGEDVCIGISIAGLFEDGTPFAHYFGVNHETGENVSEVTLSMIDWVLTLEDRLLIFANPMFDFASLETVGIHVRGIEFIDICTMAHLINENWPLNKGVDSLGKHYCDTEKVVDPFVEAEKISGNRTITPEQMWEYAVQDAVITWRVWDTLLDHKEWKRLPQEVWLNKIRLISGPLVEMKKRGIRIDTGLAAEYVAKGEAEMKRLARELGYPAIPKKPTKRNPEPDPDPMPTLGPKALEEIFIERLKLPVVKASEKTGKPSFDKTVMEEYDIMLERIDSPEAKLVKEYRGWQKAVSAAYRPYIELLDTDGRLRCSYKTHGTKTGRFSCEKPNLQQIPKASDKPWNGKVKECFIPEDGFTLINADFSQLELRLATAYAGEPHLKVVFEEGRDIFTEMAEQLGMTRQDTKTLVYSMQYGAGLPRLMSAFGVTKQRAQQIRENYFATFPLFKMLSDRIAASAEQRKEARLWNGRYRHFQYASEAFKAMNSVIQGGAADIVEMVMVRCFEELDSDDCRMLLQVHDSITWEVRNELVEEMMPRIREVMADVSAAVGHNDFDVTFAVEVEFWTGREQERYEAWREDMGLAA